jgi:hypothetical protein
MSEPIIKPRTRRVNNPATIEENVAEAVKIIAEAAKEAGKLIASSAEDAKRALANSAEDSRRAIASAAAEAMKVSNVQGSGDHDLLIELKTLMTVMQSTVTEIKTGTSSQISDHEQRLKKCENKNANYFIVLGIYTLATIALIGLVVSHMIVNPTI